MFEMDLTVRISETVLAGHVSNTVLAVWFEEGRTPLYKEVLPELSQSGWPIILANYSVNFHAELFLGKPVQLKTSVKRIGNSSFETYQEAWQDGKLCASGSTVQVYFNYQTGKSEALPEATRQGLMKHLTENAG
ncbi:acyl-CoA thioesterase [Alteromonas lipolytica]|uniref:Thioesterase n=1 Tax=Alteromonas lipolytica TaxID=1856405 RepID=A0A1E8FJU4_9ALTE|nr:thioesterase family protein [Alteromonas lipolytica]OFI36184.1 hypothetical protein BFC17_08645 [Alteromonas lipolytica]GGF78484.1 thioesterase [Alteromonas lipolytica]